MPPTQERLKQASLTLAALATCLIISSCTTHNENEQSYTKVGVNSLHVSPVVHDTLTQAQLEKVKLIYDTFSEVQPGTLESTITDFKRDQNPDNEIAIWLSMANAYQKFLQKKGRGLELAAKKEAFKLILLRSEMPAKEAVAEAQPRLLSPADVSDILGFYDQAPKPIKVYHSR